jgi:GTPase SAR1 family protein
MPKLKGQPRCIVIAGPNGAGKTTFARRFLPDEVRVVNFVNADLIASGFSPLKPELAEVAAARLPLREIDRLTGEFSAYRPAAGGPLGGVRHRRARLLATGATVPEG